MLFKLIKLCELMGAFITHTGPVLSRWSKTEYETAQKWNDVFYVVLAVQYVLVNISVYIWQYRSHVCSSIQKCRKILEMLPTLMRLCELMGSRYVLVNIWVLLPGLFAQRRKKVPSLCPPVRPRL